MIRKNGASPQFIPIKKVIDNRLDLVKQYLTLCENERRANDITQITKIFSEANIEIKNLFTRQEAPIPTTTEAIKKKKRKNTNSDLSPRKKTEDVREDDSRKETVELQELNQRLQHQIQMTKQQYDDLNARNFKLGNHTKSIMEENKNLKTRVASLEGIVAQQEATIKKLEADKRYASEFDRELARLASEQSSYVRASMDMWGVMEKTLTKLKTAGTELLSRSDSMPRKDGRQFDGLEELTVRSQGSPISNHNNTQVILPEQQYWSYDQYRTDMPNNMRLLEFSDDFVVDIPQGESSTTGDLANTFMNLTTVENTGDETHFPLHDQLY